MECLSSSRVKATTETQKEPAQAHLQLSVTLDQITKKAVFK